MKKTICLLLVVVLCFSIMPTCYASADAVAFSDDPKAIQVASNSVIMLSCYDKNGELYCSGSAFAAFEEGVFVTNCHVIEGEVYSIKAQMETGLEFKISSVVAYDADRDLAILRTEAKTGLEPLPLGKSADLERGEKVIAIGSPLGLINTLSIGLNSGTIKNEDEQVFLQFSAAISHGSSGGALFNNEGEVIGITSASYTEGQNLNLAIPIEDAVELWEKRDSSAELSIPEFYDLWDHTYLYSVSYILSHQSEFSISKTAYTEGYVFIDPYDNNNKFNKYYLVETLSDYSALCNALEELNSCGGPLKGFAALEVKYGNISELDEVSRKTYEVQKNYEDLLSTLSFTVLSNNNTVSSGNYVVLQGDIVNLNDVPHLVNVVIIEKH